VFFAGLNVSGGKSSEITIRNLQVLQGMKTLEFVPANHAHILSYHRRLLFNDSRFSRGKARSNTAIYFHYILLSSDTI
jgi:hypothetical protein